MTAEMLGGRFDELGEKVVEILEERSRATDGSLWLPQEYVLCTIRR